MDEQLIHLLWNKASKIEGLNPAVFRKDSCGALIMRDKYDMQNPFGWVVDHIFPKSLGGNDDIDNLRALHYQNNLSKADDYPSYTAVIKYDGKQNVRNERNLTVNPFTRKKLKTLYKNA